MFPITITITLTPALLLAVLFYDLLLIAGVVWLVRRWRARAASPPPTASWSAYPEIAPWERPGGATLNP